MVRGFKSHYQGEIVISSSTTRRVLVTGASPDRFNRNAVMRRYVSEGFGEVVGSDNVWEVGLESAARLIKTVHPDITVCFGSCMPDDADYGGLRKACDDQNSKLVFWLHDDPYEFDFNYKVTPVADYIFSNDKWAVAHYDHPNVYHLPMASSLTSHFRPITAKKEIDVFFCGVAFANRMLLISDLQGVLNKLNTVVLGDQWPTGEFAFARNRRIGNSELADHYARATITLNIGRNFSYANDRFQLSASTPGPRTFEAGMAGTVQLFFVESLEIEEYYMPDKEIFLFDAVADFEKIATMLLEQPEYASQVAAAAQQRTMRDHTYASRAKRLVDVVAA